ncbi:transcription elongation factor SPT6 homolog [Magnolia sinica]|uniref:transcription elongation factor SPT6 homolog n=1 Tax=Magnolia sinica TaxID=86752 RepID=UPI0026594A88|nr:transcription elongation factor SPT6 homolog [Magnolia sinica]
MTQTREELLEDDLEQTEMDPDEPVVEDEADDDDDDDNDDKDDEEEEGQDEYEKDGFIVDDVDEEEEEQEEEDDRGSDEEEKHKKKKRRKRESEKNYLLDEDDYVLLQDNNITGFHRPKPGSKKFKRLKKAGRDTEREEGSGFSDGEEIDRSGHSARTDEEKLKHSLFGDDEGAALEDIAEEEEQPEEEDGDIGEDDEMADFIVDEEEVDDNGAPLRRKKPSKKKSRQAPGVSSSALQEAHDIFGDVDELLLLRKRGLQKGGSYDDSGEWREKRLEDEFEPSILAEKYMTEKDDRIREIDVPERIQLSEEVTGPVPTDDTSIEEESTWIYNQLTVSDSSPFFGNMLLVDEINKEDIGNVLGMLHVQKFDIPFIATYRKELCLSLLKDPEQDLADGEDRAERTPKLKWHKKLWAVQNLDKKWLLLQKRKNALQLYYNKRFQEEARRIDDETRLALNQQLFNSILESLKVAESEREVDDVDAKFNLHFPPGEVEVEEGQFKRPKRKSLYSICSKAGLWEVANKFGFSSEQFGLLLNLEKMRVDELEDAKETPDEIAANFTCAMFETPQDVLKGARHMAAVEISCEPSVRKHVRSIFMEKAVVSTSPTPDGKTAIDYFHQFATVKWLDEKPFYRFKDAQWLLIQKAEEEKLLQVTIKLPENVQTKLISDSNDYYISDGVSKSAQLWNEQRKLILKDAFFSFLLPSMEKEARSLLTARAKNWLLMEYGKQLWNRVSVAPYQRKDTDAGSEDDAAPRVMACCWGPGKPATTFVMLDSSGEMLDVLYTGSLSLRSPSANEQQRKKNDQQRLLKFMTDHQPHVVILGAVNLNCKRLKDDIYEVIFKIVEEHPREVGQEIDAVSVAYGDESLPRLYENSQISSDQLTAKPGIVKRAVALGRYLQNPLAMIATLCGPGREILSWKLNTLEHFLTPDEKYGVVEHVMIDATNQVGVDINLAASHEWLFSPLQFVSGLGPRKASALQKALVRAGVVFSRKEIPMNGVLKKKVFINAVGFLRVRRTGLANASSHFMDLLDDTRIHPESYDLAKNMAKVVYDEDVQEDPNEMDDDAQEMAIDHVMRNPRLLKVLDIGEYANSVEERLGTRKRETLMDIKMELLHGFQDWRTPYTEPSQDEEFYMLSGETEETLEEGRTVQVMVRRVTPQRATCGLDSGLTGVILRDELSEDGNVDPMDSISEGSILTCKIKGVQKNRLQVILTCRGDDLIIKRLRKIQELESFYREPRGNSQSDQDTARKEKELAKKHFKPRMIAHRNFKNWTTDEAVQFLSDKDAGESIIRPSSRGPSYLTLTLKIYDGVYAHKDIVEGGKDHKDITSLLRLGKTLKIDDETFEDLDEVVDRYVDPLVTNLKAMLQYRKFKKGTKVEVDDLLRMEKSEYPMRIVYCFGISHEHPGTIILSYIRSTNPHHEYIGLYPKGLKFRKRMFESIDRLVAYFQKHIDDLQHESMPSIRSVAAMVPMKSPTTGGSSGGGSVGSGWGGSTANSSDGGWRGSDRDRSSTPGSRTGRNDYRNSGGRGGHPSGLPRPYGRGRGRGSYHHGRGNHHSGSEGHDSGYGSSSKWGSGAKEDDNELSSFPGAKVQNSPGREAFPGGWGNSGSGDGDNWGNGGNDGGSNWGNGGSSGGGSGWGSGRGGGGGWSGGNSSGGDRWGGGDGGSGTGGNSSWDASKRAGPSRQESGNDEGWNRGRAGSRTS